MCGTPAINMAYPRRFRSYEVRENRSANCTIYEAARITTAAPTVFKEITISDESGIPERFIDGGLKCNNPTNEVTDEARLFFGNDRQLGTLTSLGAGHSGTIGFSAPDAFRKLLPNKLIDVLKDLATDCEKVAREVEEKWINLPGRYFRFSVTHGTEKISLDEWKKIGDVKTHTNSYLLSKPVSKEVDALVAHLCGKAKPDFIISLGEACTSTISPYRVSSH